MKQSITLSGREDRQMAKSNRQMGRQGRQQTDRKSDTNSIDQSLRPTQHK